MKTDLAKVVRIQELMMELQSELESLSTYETELHSTLNELDKETVDILHIAESIAMSGDEKIKLVDRTHELRNKRREVKVMLGVVVPFAKVTKSISRLLKEKNPILSEVVKSVRPGASYSFRSQSGYELLKSIIPNYAERSPVYLYAPSSALANEATPSESTSEENVVTTTVPEAVPAPPKVEIAPLKESTVDYQIIRVCNKWTLRDGLTLVLETLELKEVIDYLFVNGWQSVSTDMASKAQLKRDLREFKTGEEDTNRFVHCSRLQQRLF